MKNKIKGENKSFRLLNLYERLSRGERLVKDKVALFYDVDKRSIQRDIADLNEYLYQEGNAREIIFNRELGGYELRHRGTLEFSDSDIYAICKVLLDARAFSIDEMNRILETLLSGCLDRPVIEDTLANERFHYTQPRHGKPIVDFLWKISQSIRFKQTTQVRYIKQDGSIKTYEINPLGLVFNEYYFYLIAEKSDDETHAPRVYRVDRFETFAMTDKTFTVPYKDRFQEGEFRKRIQFMYTGALTTITFKFWGDSLEAILDRLPTAKVVGHDGDKTIVEAEVYGEGVKRWLLSQKEYLEVIKPKTYREEVKATVEKMGKVYE
ncbi:MAG: WYL domain-containing protein [Eubacterium sp.]